MTTAVLVDDHPAVIAGIRAWCADAQPPIDVLAAGGSPAMAWTEPGASADVVVLDLMLDGGVPALNELRRLIEADRRVIVYSMREDNGIALTCLDIGAATYLRKAEGYDHLISAIRAVAADRPYTSPALAGAMGTDNRSGRPKLTPRESDALLSWFRCESKELVAAKLGVSVSTVNTYLDRVRIKYANVGREASTKAALLARAIQDGLIGLEDL